MKKERAIPRRRGAGPRLAAIGLEAEFTLTIDGEPVRPEDAFGDPRAFIRAPLMHRQGTSYHLPTGGAVYFDTGVIEVTTPVIEIGAGCAARAARSLWEGIAFVRRELDAWERRTGRTARLAGFSTHYNVSFDEPPNGDPGRNAWRLGYLLTHLAPAPVALLAANRRSTGVGLRPRKDRIEVTVDFTPDPALMTAAAAAVVALVRHTMEWPGFTLEEAQRRGLPVPAAFHPEPHSSRKGWVARYSSFPRNPFAAPVDERLWLMLDGRRLSFREWAAEILAVVATGVERFADLATARHIAAVLAGDAPSLLELEDRPPSYDDVGRLCAWGRRSPGHRLARSRYERVFMRAVAGQRIRIGGRAYTPTGTRGWSHVILRRDDDGSRHALSLDQLLDGRVSWDRARADDGPPDGRDRRERRGRRDRRKRAADRRGQERRAALERRVGSPERRDPD
jgi:hypothetical protein